MDAPVKIWSRPVQIGAAFLLGVAVALTLGRVVSLHARPRPTERPAPTGTVFPAIEPARWAAYQPDSNWPGDQPPKQAGKKKELLPGETIDVNAAGPDELQRLPGVGPVTAAKIIAERQREPFRKPEDLRRVSGVGPKTLDKLRPHVRFSSPAGS